MLRSSVAVSLLVLCLWIAACPLRASSDAYLYCCFRPCVIYDDGADATTLEVATTRTDVREVQVRWNGEEWLPMYDDGTHGDRVARDGVYALDGLTCDPLPSTAFVLEGLHTTASASVSIVKANGSVEQNSEPTYGIVHREERWAVRSLATGLSATAYAFLIHDPAGGIVAGFPVVDVEGGRPFSPACRKLYSVVPDVFDFVVVMPNGRIFRPQSYGERVPYCVMIKNDIGRIAVPLFNEAATYGSTGRLRAVIYHSWGVMAILDHELAHAWGMKMGHMQGLVPDAVPGGRYGHWAAETDINGQLSMYAFVNGWAKHMVYNGDNTWRLTQEGSRETRPYAPLELYIMGLLPASAVPPVHALVDPDYTDPQRVTAREVKTFTIQQLQQAASGERQPAYPNTQRSFRMALVVVSDRPFTAAEAAFYSLEAAFFCLR